MGFFDTIKNSFQSHLDKKKEQRDFEDRLRFEAKVQEKQIFEQQFKKDALEVSRSRAMKEAAEKSGLQKLRAVNRARRLTESGDTNQGTMFSKLSEMTQRNIAKREQNLKRTQEMRDTAKKMREDRMQKQVQERQQRMSRANQRRSTFGGI